MASSSNIKKVLAFQIFLDRKLGEGAYGIVYLAKNTFSSEQVACKVTKFKTSEEKADVEQEIHILEQLRDIDGVIKYHGSHIDEATGEAYLFMQQMDDTFDKFLQEPDHMGPPLEISEIKTGGRLPEGEALFYFYQLLKTISNIHARGLMHRDLKPENLFLQGNKLYLGDFNLSKFASLTHSVVGTPMYMCPIIVMERLGGFGNYVDLWSAGHILYRILVGFHYYEYMKVRRRLKSVDEYVRVMANKLEDEGVLFPAEIPISAGTKELIRKLLDKDKIKGLSAAKLLEEPIFAKYKKEDEERMRRSTNMMVRSALTKSVVAFDGGVGANSNVKWTKALFESLSSKVEYLEELRSRIMEFQTETQELITKEPRLTGDYTTILAHTQYLNVLTGAMLMNACKNFSDVTSKFEVFQSHATQFKKSITQSEFYQLIVSLEEDGKLKVEQIEARIPELTKELKTLSQGLRGLSENKQSLLGLGLNQKSTTHESFYRLAMKVVKDYRLFLCENYHGMKNEFQKISICYIAGLIEQLAIQEAKLRLTVWSRVAVAVLHTDLPTLQQKVESAAQQPQPAKAEEKTEPSWVTQYLVYISVLLLLFIVGFFGYRAISN